MTEVTLLLFLLVIVGLTLCAASDGNETEWCHVCACNLEEEDFVFNCAGKSLYSVPSAWPKQLSDVDFLNNIKLVVSFNDNNLTKVPAIAELHSKSVTVSFRRCNIQGIEYSAFKNIPQIYFLDLGYNKLTGDAVRGDIFRGPYNKEKYEPIDLEVLNLEHNSIHSLERRMFQHTPKLKQLLLNNNPMDVIDSVTILAVSSIKKLEVLDLSYVGVASIPNDLFRNSKHLKTLNLAGNNLKSVPESLGAVGASLIHLILNNNFLGELNDNSFLGLWRLETLEIGGMDTLEDVKAGTFVQLLSLKILHLCHNTNLDTISSNAFRELKSNWPIQELYLNDNNLRRISLDLAKWEDLSVINLENNPWECDCEMVNAFTAMKIAKKLQYGSKPTCMTPLELSGESLTTILQGNLCPAGKPNRTRRVYYRMLHISRPGSVLIALGFVCLVVVVGLGSGCVISHCRKRIRNRIAMEPVKYTNIRS